jgi:hypothetical protein
MKLLCEHCGSTNDATAVRVAGDRVWMTCGRCGTETTVVAAAVEPPRAGGEPPPRGEDAPAPPGAVKCPRCFHRQDLVEHCHRCGLDLSRPRVDATDWDDVQDVPQETLARATEMWEALRRDPQDASRHEAFVAHCTEKRLLTWAVRRYREYLADHPGVTAMEEHRDRAARKLETVALTLMASDRWSEDVARRARVLRRVLLLVAALLLVAGLVLLVVVFKRTGSLSPPAF